MIHRLKIQGRLPSLNELIEANRTDPRAGARLKRETQELIGWHIKAQMREPVKAPVNVLCIFCEPDRRRDVDNITSAHKYILDALVETGVLPGDGQKHVRHIYDEVTVDKDHPRVEVILMEVQ